MRYCVLKMLWVGIAASLTIGIWSFFRLNRLQDGAFFACIIGASSLATHVAPGFISVAANCRTPATTKGALLRIVIAFVFALLAGYLWLLAYGWARSFGIHGEINGLPSSAEEARFHIRTDGRVAQLCLLLGMSGSLVSSVIASGYVRRDFAQLVIACVAGAALVATSVSMIAA